MAMLFGRKKIMRDETSVTRDNVVEIVSETFRHHMANSSDIRGLYRYYRGDQPILQREKTIRPEINNKIVENRANEIVAFKTGYLCGEPLQYVSRAEKEATAQEIGKLNDLMCLCGKNALDSQLAEWMYICGTGYRMVLPNSREINNGIIPKLQNAEVPFSEDEAPFEIFTLDPRFCYVVYNTGLGEKPLCGVKYVIKHDKSLVFSVYTGTEYFEFEGTTPFSGATNLKQKPFATGYIPLIEYPLNNARLGAFEVVLPILNAINTVQSNRIDGIEQFVASLLVLYNADIDDDAVKHLREAGLIKLKSHGDGNKADIKELCQELNQQQTQVLVDYMYQTVLNIIGMPNRNGGSSTSDTGSAVELRDGWSAAETRAKQDETMFKNAELSLLRIVLRIMRDTVGTSLKLSDIDIKFTRRNYEAIQSKAQVLISMLNCDKIHPQLAYDHCGLFSDPEAAYLLSQKYYDTLCAQQPSTDEQNEGEDSNAGGEAIA